MLTDEIKIAIIQPALRPWCKVIRKPEFEKVLLVESGMLGFGIQECLPFDRKFRKFRMERKW